MVDNIKGADRKFPRGDSTLVLLCSLVSTGRHNLHVWLALLVTAKVFGKYRSIMSVARQKSGRGAKQKLQTLGNKNLNMVMHAQKA